MTKGNKMASTFKIDQRVEFIKTSDIRLDGVVGTVVGFSSRHAEMDFYIVLLDVPLGYSDVKALAITEHCLKAI